LLLRGAEGEAVAHPRREPAMDWLNGTALETWSAGAAEDPPLPKSRDAAVTAEWNNDALAGKHPIPAAIAHQVGCCVRATRLVAEQPLRAVE
jgi:anthranilate phosphoribosyltransferase